MIATHFECRYLIAPVQLKSLRARSRRRFSLLATPEKPYILLEPDSCPDGLTY